MGSESLDGWPLVAIDELKTAIAIGPFGSRMKADCYVASGVPVIRGNNLTDTRSFKGEFVYITEATAESMRNCIVVAGDLVFPHRGAIGEVGIIPDDGRHYMLSTSLMKLTPDLTKADSLFLFYFFRSAHGRHELLKHASTVGTPGIGQPLKSLRSIRIPLPPLTEQRAIARILGTLDDKIELNRRMNETLEGMARAIFKSWFVDFDPVRAKADGRQPVGMDPATAALFPDSFEDSPLGKIPKGWKVEALSGHVEAVKGLSYKGSGLTDSGTPLHNLNSVFEGGGYKHHGIKFYSGEFKERHLVRPGDVIVTNTEQGFEYLLIGYPAIVPHVFGDWGLFSHHLYRVRPLQDSPLLSHFLYHLLMGPIVREQVVGCSNGTTVNMLPADGLQRPLFCVPPKGLIEQFDRLASALWHRSEQNLIESHSLASLRDNLLPRLLSGEIRIPEAEKLDEVAT